MTLFSGQNDDGAFQKMDIEKFDKAIHLIVGDPKFLSSCQANFQWLEPFLESAWVICNSYEEVDKQAVDHFLQEAKGVRSLIFVHGLWPTNKEILRSIDSSIHKTIGFLWGGDYTSDVISRSVLYARKTRELLKRLSSRGQSMPFWFYDPLHLLLDLLRKRTSRQDLCRHLNKLDFVVCGWEADETRFLPCSDIKTLPNFNPYYQTPPICNTTVDNILQSNREIKVLIGNSGTPTNNHLDVIEMIERANPAVIFQFTVIISYGDSRYIEILKAALSTKKNVHFIDAFVPLKQFNQLILEHDILAIGTRRQQGNGFIQSAYLHNKPLMLFENSMAFNYLRRNNFSILALNHSLSASDFSSHKWHQRDHYLQMIENRKEQFKLFVQQCSAPNQ